MKCNSRLNSKESFPPTTIRNNVVRITLKAANGYIHILRVPESALEFLQRAWPFVVEGSNGKKQIRKDGVNLGSTWVHLITGRTNLPHIVRCKNGDWLDWTKNNLYVVQDDAKDQASFEDQTSFHGTLLTERSPTSNPTSNPTSKFDRSGYVDYEKLNRDLAKQEAERDVKPNTYVDQYGNTQTIPDYILKMKDIPPMESGDAARAREMKWLKEKAEEYRLAGIAATEAKAKETLDEQLAAANRQMAEMAEHPKPMTPAEEREQLAIHEMHLSQQASQKKNLSSQAHSVTRSHEL
jgi:hypothetical protein